MHDQPPNVVAQPEQAPKKSGRRQQIRTIITTAAILVAAPLVAILLTAFVFQSYEVDGPSMQTTLHNNDRLIVWKLPRTWARITGHQYVPKRGDIVVFVGGPALTPYGQDASRQLIKRVVALPGERVQVKDGKLVVYNAQHPNGFDPDDTLSYGKVIGDTEPMNTNGIITLGPNQIFVCGDNRPDSLDSRSFGPVNTNQIVGTLAARVLPLSSAERF
ncbi:MAG TPA: signal peptidase I [Candidatus Saccharimonadales bacterium]